MGVRNSRKCHRNADHYEPRTSTFDTECRIGIVASIMINSRAVVFQLFWKAQNEKRTRRESRHKLSVYKKKTTLCLPSTRHVPRPDVGTHGKKRNLATSAYPVCLEAMTISTFLSVRAGAPLPDDACGRGGSENTLRQYQYEYQGLSPLLS